jgi:hypothetical protein
MLLILFSAFFFVLLDPGWKKIRIRDKHSDPQHYLIVRRYYDVLVRIRIRQSIPGTSGLTDPDPALTPNPAIFVSDLQDGNKQSFFCLLLFEGTITCLCCAGGSGGQPPGQQPLHQRLPPR